MPALFLGKHQEELKAFQPHATTQLLKYVFFLNAAPAGTLNITIMLQTVFFDRSPTLHPGSQAQLGQCLMSLEC